MEGAESSDIHGEMLREQDHMLRELAATLGSLRRVAMLIARGRPPEAVFAAVAREALRYLGDGSVSMFRYEPDGTTTLLAQEGIKLAPGVRVGEHRPSGPSAGLTATVLRTGRPARIDDYQDAPGVGPYLLTGLRSAVAMPVHVQGRLWGTIAVGSAERLLPCDTERRMADLTDLVAIAVANAQGRADLIASRARLVTASDDIRRRIERDLHDGVQQRLVAVVYRLRAGVEAVCEPDAVRIEIDDVATELMGVLDDLRELSRGIHPAILSRGGLRPALRALARRSPVPAKMDVRIRGRLPEPVEVGAYYVVSEALANAAKHAQAAGVEVSVRTVGDLLYVTVRDDGVGGAEPVRGSGLRGLKDRVEALGGTFTVDSPAGRGTTVSCALPLELGGGTGT
ncbi:GAF domain-containing sensor histidine kinase [Streptomyces sp. NBC_00648]|uniref:GAF domain-containing sensor histidine kinase n=1 Tax=Streptomyces sp. NBC_00648 TaxID=2975797 RepID=UPI00325072B6